MSNKKLARRYAQALVSLGKEANVLSELSSSLHSFAEALQTGDRILYHTMTNPSISFEEKRSVLKSIASQLGTHLYANNTIQLLLERDRIAIFTDLVASFDEMADSELNRVRATVKTATEISEEEKTKLRSILSKAHSVPVENLIIEFEIVPALIGGLIAKIGDTTYDGSVRSQLKEIQHILQ